LGKIFASLIPPTAFHLWAPPIHVAMGGHSFFPTGPPDEWTSEKSSNCFLRIDDFFDILHKNIQDMQIALYTLTSCLHKETIRNAAEEPFIKSVEAALDEKFLFCGDNFSEYGRHETDIIYVRTGGTEGLFKALNLKGNVKILTSGESNSLAASMEILSYLRMNGQKGEILHGSPEYIADRIKGNGAEIGNVPSAIEPFGPVNMGVRLGVIGKPSDWLISSDVDYEKAKRRLNVEIVDIPMKELISRLPDCDMRSFEGSEAIYEGLKGIVKDYGLGGLTIRCFDLLDSVHNTGCLALARLNAEGVPSSCEGDIPALISMMYLQKTKGCPGFQCNLSRIEGDELLFAHCTVPLQMVSSFKYATHFESGIGTAIKGELLEGDVEIFKISPDLEHCIRIPGRILRNSSEPNLCRTQIIVKAPSAPSYMLHSPLANHHIISYL